MRVAYEDFSSSSLGAATTVVEELLATYDGSAIESLIVSSAEPQHKAHGRLKKNSIYAYTVSLRGGWTTMLRRSYAPREWNWAQSCPDCGGGSRWAPMGTDARGALLSCGGCGLALASPNSGISHWLDWAVPSTFPLRDLDQQLDEHGFDTLQATLEASSLVSLVQKLIIGAEDTLYWSDPSHLEVLKAGEFVDLPPDPVV